MSDTPAERGTLIHALCTELGGAAAYNETTEAAPAAILWTDEKREWEALLPRLRSELPELFTLGEYAPDDRTGPAIWLKCVIARTLPEVEWPADTTPILYLPGVSRQQIRAVETCPKLLQPLAELQYRGTFWTQTNARDWTLFAFLSSEHGGLGLDVARDEATQEAMRRALVELADTDVSRLRGKRLEADDFHNLITPDPVRDLLVWLNEPDATRKRWSENKWASFRTVCQNDFRFDPQDDGPILAARKLGLREGAWAKVWQRFIEAPKRYPHVPDRLAQARPPETGNLFAHEKQHSWPQENEAQEDDLRSRLKSLDGAMPSEATQEIEELDEDHGPRRDSVWADLGRAPLGQALAHLVELAEAVQQPVGGAIPDTVARSYREDGWKADAAALAALNAVRGYEDQEAVSTAVRALYQLWLQDGAEALQRSIAEHGIPEPAAPIHDAAKPGEVLLFADALRFDMGQVLLQRLEQAGLGVDVDWQWSALPSITATAKPALTPVAESLSRQSESTEFRPQLATSGSDLSTHSFRKEMEELGYQILSDHEVGDPSGSAWTEVGTLDRHGHDEQERLAWRVEEVLQEIQSRVGRLFDAGWQTVHIVTDHGWLLLPGGLPKEALPGFLAETRWGRCAMLKETSTTDLPVVPWHWNHDKRIAMAPGISVFRNGLAYAHGGVSVQECVVPRLTVHSRQGSGSMARIAEVEWRHLRCRVQIENAASGMKADLRTKANSAASSVALKAKAVDESGRSSLVVPDDEYEGTAAFVVLLDQDDQVVGTLSTTIGGTQ